MVISVTLQLALIFYVVNSVASALVQALPVPNGNVVYTFIYKFLSLLIADFKSFSATIPTPQLQLTAPKTTTVIAGTSITTQSNAGVL